MGLERFEQLDTPPTAMDPENHPAYNKPTATHDFSGDTLDTGPMDNNWIEVGMFKGKAIDPYKLSPKDLKTYQHYKDRKHN